MTEIMLAVRNESDPVVASPLAMLEANNLVAYRVRGNGTTRMIGLLPLGSTERDVAEWIYDEIEEGRSFSSVAREVHSSEATVRRTLLALEITLEVEAGDWDDVWRAAQGFAPVTLDEPVEGDIVVVVAGELPCQEDNGNEVVAPRFSPSERAASAEAGVVFS